MNDILLQLGQNPQARKLVKTLGLPLPMPQTLARAKGPMEQRPLHDYEIAVGGHPGEGQSVLVDVVAATLTQAGATPLVVGGAVLPPAFLEHGEAWGRPPRGLMLDALPDKLKLDGMVFDATEIRDAAGLRSVYEFFHPLVRSLGRCGRVVLLARPPAAARTPSEAAAQAAIEGFVRSLGKELGKSGATANVIYVDEDAERLVEGPLRYLLSRRSAFVSGQPLHVSARTVELGEDGRALAFEPIWVRPLEGKVALVTGAARGIGKATAKLLADEGAHVVCLDRPADDELVAAVAREIGGTPLLVDVSDPEAAQTIAKTLREDHGGVDIVVHNAGITRDKTLARMKPEHWDLTMAINLDAVIRITDALVGEDGPLLDDGRIIVLSSIAGIAGNLGQTNYAATKAGVIGYVQRLADELEGRGVTVNAIAPGFIETRLTAAIPVMIREVGRRLASLGQGGLPRDIGDAITFLSTPGAQGLTANVVRVCGQSFVGA
jgi:3-oxoacyl-[acyl-carrier protein] reductase